jgi:protein-disulfide isomerase
MKRRTIWLIILVVVLLAGAVFVVNYKNNSADNSLGSKNNLNESENLLAVNSAAISSANAKVNATTPAISDADQLLLGTKDSKLKMVVYEDLTNPYSLSYDAILQQAVKNNPDKLAVYVRPYFEADNSLALTYQTAVACAGEEEKYNELRSFIIAEKPLTVEALVDGAQKLGLNKSKLSACLNNSELQAKIVRSVEDIRMIAVYGAPTSILDGKIITGARALADTKNGEGENIEGLTNIITRHLTE